MARAASEEASRQLAPRPSRLCACGCFAFVSIVLRSMKLLAVSTAILFLLAGCGTPGAPQPPSLRLPKPVENLHATRVGDKVELAWTMPFETTDGDGIREPGTIEICRVLPNPETLECRDGAGQLALPIAVTQTNR